MAHSAPEVERRIGISAIAYALPPHSVTLDALERAGLLESPAATLRAFGFAHALVSEEPAHTLALVAASRLIEAHAIDPEQIDALFYAGAIPSSHAIADGGALGGFRYPAARLQYELGLLNAQALGLSQVGCLGMMRAVRAASDFLIARPGARRALCVSADVLPAGACREIIYNVISDGACALLVEAGAPRNRILAVRDITKGYYWDCDARRREIVAAYFPTARHVVSETLAAAGVAAADIACVIPHNVSHRSWEILLRLIEMPAAKLFADNIAAKGHVIAADNFINLHDAAAAGRLTAGDRLLLFTFGFGANWGAMVIEH